MPEQRSRSVWGPVGMALLGAAAGCAAPQQQQQHTLALDPLTIRPSVAMVQLDPQGKEIKIAGRIEFQSNKDVMLASSHALLDQVADLLQRNAQIARLEIQGHTDDRGDTERNQTLSQQRADAVRAYLITKGISGDRLQATGFGEQRPIDHNDTAAGRAKNRRVEFHIIGDRAVSN